MNLIRKLEIRSVEEVAPLSRVEISIDNASKAELKYKYVAILRGTYNFQNQFAHLNRKTSTKISLYYGDLVQKSALFRMWKK